jgi:acyl carrier protein
MKLNSNDLRGLLIDVFQNSEIPADITNLRINDVEEWDSLGNFNLLLAVEDQYNMKFDLAEMPDLNSVRSILLALEKRD